MDFPFALPGSGDLAFSEKVFAAGKDLKSKFLSPALFALFGLGAFLPPFAAYLGSEAKEVISFYPLLFLPFFVSRFGGKPAWLPALSWLALHALSALLGYRFTLWLSALFAVFALLPAFGFRMARGGYLLFFLIPPWTDKLEFLGGFELRLVLSRLTADLLRFLDPTTLALGNALTFQGREALIDSACEGLRFGVATTLLGLILFQSSGVRRFFRPRVFLFSIMLPVFWLAGNLARIIFLVLFEVPAGTARHDVVGILLFLFVTALPVVLLSLFLLDEKTPETNTAKVEKKAPVEWDRRLAVSIMGFLFLSSFLRMAVAGLHPVSAKLGESLIGGDTREALMTEKREAGQTLLIKEMKDPFRIAHHPLQCHRGLGYRLVKQGTTQTPNGVLRWATVSHQDPSRFPDLEIRWWYECGASAVKKSDELAWRLELLRGNKPVRLYNEIKTRRLP